MLTLVAAGAWIVSSSTLSELERYKAQLRARGEKLLASELAIAPSTNAAEVACRNVFATNQTKPPAFLPSLMSYTGPGTARLAWRESLKLDNGAASWGELEDQVSKAEPGLEILRRSLEHPAPDCEWVYVDAFQSNRFGPKPNFVLRRAVAQDLACAVICALHKNDFGGAFTNLHALVNLSRLDKNELLLVSGMIRVAIANLGLQATWEALQAPGWDEARLAQLQGDWEQFNALDALERSMLGERAMSQSIMAWVRKASGREFDSAMRLWTGSTQSRESLMTALAAIWRTQVVHSAYKAFAVNADELEQLEYYEEALKGIRQLKSNEGWVRAGNTASNALSVLDQKLSRDKLHRLRLTAMIVPNTSRAMNVAAQNETLRRLTIAAIAIKRFELRHGAPPVALSGLTPEFLAAVPLDPMSGKPLCYRLKADGTFVLYSTGQDGKDHDGDATPMTPAKPGLWEGKDAVWPSSVSGTEEADLVRTKSGSGK